MITFSHGSVIADFLAAREEKKEGCAADVLSFIFVGLEIAVVQREDPSSKFSGCIVLPQTIIHLCQR